MRSVERTINRLALGEVGVVLAAQQAVAIATDDTLDVSRRVSNGISRMNRGSHTRR